MTSSNNLVLPSVDNEYTPQFCRACARKLRKPSCEIENNSEKPELPLLLKRYVPEFDVKVEKACLCTDCISILYVFHQFKRKCLRTEETLRLHIRQYPEVKTVDLNEVFDTENLRIIKATKTLHKCEVCGMKFAGKSVLLGHMKVKHNRRPSAEEKLTCKTCNRAFLYKKSLQKHIEFYHIRDSYQCNKCSRDFVSKTLYDAHLKYHKKPDSDRFVCKICNFVYPSRTGLDNHNISKHKSEDQLPFGCKICARRFMENSTLKKHMRMHTGERPFKCKMCPYSGRYKNFLNRHLWTMHRDTTTMVD